MQVHFFNRLLFLTSLVLLSSYTSNVWAQVSLGTPQRISVGSAGASPNAESDLPILSANGRFLVFQSQASNLVSSDSNFSTDIFLRDTNTGVTSRISVSSSGTQGDADSLTPAISPVSANGSFAIAFESDASNLSSIVDTSGNRDIFLHIPSLPFTNIISVGPGGAIPSADCVEPSVTLSQSANQVLVVYASTASNLVSSDTNGRKDVFLATVNIPTSVANFRHSTDVSTTRISKSFSSGVQSNGNSFTPKISGNGKYVVFTSLATNLVASIQSSFQQIYLYEIAADKTSLISKTSAGVVANLDSSNPVISYNGRYIVYLTQATNTISGSTSLTKVVRYDSQTGITQQVNTSSSGVAGDGDALDCSISADGRFVTFTDRSTNLVSGDTNGNDDEFIKDMDTGAITRISVSSSGAEANGDSARGSFARSGYNTVQGTTSFLSNATNMVSGASGLNEVFLNTLTLAKLPFTNSTRIEVPPDISLSGSVLNLTLQPFSKVAGATLALQARRITRAAQSKPPKRIKYDVRIEKEGGSSKDNRRKVVKRNQTTIRNLKPGTYTARYRVLVTRGQKTVRRSGFSPNQRFSMS